SMVLYSKPKERRVPVYIVNIRDVEETVLKGKSKADQKPYWQKIAADQKALETGKETNNDVGKLRDARETEQQDYELKEFARHTVDFLKKNPPKLYSEDHLAQH